MRISFLTSVLTTLILCLLLAQPSQATVHNQQPASYDFQFNQWMKYYYVTNDPSKMDDYLQWLQQTQILEKNAAAQAPTAAFLSVIFSHNADQVKTWAQRAQSSGLSGKTKETLEKALWLSHNEKIISDVFKDAPEYLNSPPIDMENLTIVHAEDLDKTWSAFFASGDTHYVKKIISVLAGNALTGNNTIDAAIRIAAERSLENNMWQHEVVRHFVFQETAARSGLVEERLKNLTERFKKNMTSFPNKDWDFSAMLVVTDEKSLKEFSKPANQGLTFKELSTLKIGDNIVINFVFMGMELTNDLMADVTFDLKIIAPDGNVLNNTDMKDLVAFKQKTPVRFKVFDNKNFIKMQFGPDSQPGKYRIMVTAKDNVGKRQIPLTKDMELVK
ncbi:MAG: hypothetical protein IPP74_07035 [Alphaproteobacteria bacterium]|nr:hypothetical protein [Alphaproteobacteria bacterium]